MLTSRFFHKAGAGENRITPCKGEWTRQQTATGYCREKSIWIPIPRCYCTNIKRHFQAVQVVVAFEMIVLFELGGMGYVWTVWMDMLWFFFGYNSSLINVLESIMGLGPAIKIIPQDEVTNFIDLHGLVFMSQTLYNSIPNMSIRCCSFWGSQIYYSNRQSLRTYFGKNVFYVNVLTVH